MGKPNGVAIKGKREEQNNNQRIKENWSEKPTQKGSKLTSLVLYARL